MSSATFIMPRLSGLVFATAMSAGTLLVHGAPVTPTKKAPNIVFFLIDDLGWQDVGFRENTDLKEATPFIDRIASEGIKLDQHYVQSVCTPTRGCFLTGRYAHRLGFQRGVIRIQTRDSLDLDERTLAQELQSVGYRTGIFGKWHLGNANWSMVPLQRGFDVYRGFYGGGMDFWSKKTSQYFDLHVNNNDETDPHATDEKTYSQYVYQEGVDGFLRDHAANHRDKPFFLYSAMQTVHSPLQAPIGMEDNPACSMIGDADRKIYCAMVLVTDQMVANTFATLDDLGYDKNTVVVFSADNGGNPTQGGYNMPLRGQKGSVFEGGIRGASFVWGELIPQTSRGSTYGGLMHVTDWLPTLMGLASGSHWIPEYPIDGHDVWDALVNLKPSPRNEVVHNFDSTGSSGSAIRVGDYKLIVAQAEMEWYPVPGSKWNRSSISSQRFVDECTGTGRNKKCNYLFKVSTDPTESVNLIEQEPEIAKQLKARLEAYKNEEADCNTCDSSDPEAQEAAAQSGYWRPWLGVKPDSADDFHAKVAEK